jgi:hypothetical protein
LPQRSGSFVRAGHVDGCANNSHDDRWARIRFFALAFDLSQSRTTHIREQQKNEMPFLFVSLNRCQHFVGRRCVANVTPIKLAT